MNEIDANDFVIPDDELELWKFYRYSDKIDYKDFEILCLRKEKRLMTEGRVFDAGFSLGDLIQFQSTDSTAIFLGKLEEPKVIHGSGSYIAHYELFNLKCFSNQYENDLRYYKLILSSSCYV